MNVRTFHADALAKGLEVSPELEEEAEGYITCTVTDPDGYAIEIYWDPELA